MTNRTSKALFRIWQSWPLIGLLVAGLLLVRGLTGNIALAPHVEAASATASPGRPASSFRPIEQIRVGQRVVTDLPDGILDLDGRPFDRSLADGETRVDPATWCLVRMRAEEVWADGTVDDINIETLQPLEWIEAHQIRVGHQAPIPLDLVEMGLPNELRGRVLSIAPCPPIEGGRGRVVLTTVNHLNPNVIELTLRSSTGTEASLKPTSSHKFFSIRMQAWVSAELLRPGDGLQCPTGSVVVVCNRKFYGNHRVFNLTVESDHVYRVSDQGVLTHNSRCYDPSQPISGSNYPSMGMDPADVIAKAKSAPPPPAQIPSGQPRPRRQPWNPHGPDSDNPLDGNVDNTY